MPTFPVCRRLPRLRPLAAAVLGAVLLRGQAWAARPVEKPQPVPAQADNEPGLTQGLKETGNYGDHRAGRTVAWTRRNCARPLQLHRRRGGSQDRAQAEWPRQLQRMVQQQPLKFTGGGNRLAEWSAPAADAPGDLHRAAT